MNILRSAFLAFLALSIGSISASNTSRTTPNFIDVIATKGSMPPADKKVIDIIRQGDPVIDWILPIRINREALKADSFSVFLYDRHVVVRKDAVQRYDPQFRGAWRGYVFLLGDHVDEQKSGLRSVSISLSADGTVYGTIQINQLVYEIRSLPSGGHILIKQDISKSPNDDRHDVVPNPELEPGVRPAQRANKDGDQMDTIRIAIGFTAAAQQGGSLEEFVAAANTAVSNANTSFSDSNILLTLQVAAFARPNYTETSLLQTRNDLRLGSGGPLWLVNLARVEQYADVAVMVIETTADPNCGLAPLGSTVETAVFVVQRRCFREHTLAHELGHILSANHNTEDIELPSLYDYSHGYRYLRRGRLDLSWSTVMAVPLDAEGRRAYTRLNRWSTPLQTYGGRVMGTEETHDNARVLRENKAIVAAFYPDPPPPDPLQALVPANGIKIYTPQGVQYVGH